MRWYLDIRLTDGAVAIDHDGIEFEAPIQAILAAHAEAAGLISDALAGEAILASAVLLRDRFGRTVTEVAVDLLSLISS